jgi:hypothetical protein
LRPTGSANEIRELRGNQADPAARIDVIGIDKSAAQYQQVANLLEPLRDANKIYRAFQRTGQYRALHAARPRHGYNARNRRLRGIHVLE